MEFKWQPKESDRIWITWNKSGRKSFRNNLNKIKESADKGEWMDPIMQLALRAKCDENEYKKQVE